jgi:hypothetical protein
MKTASKTSANNNVENLELHFHFNWNPTSDSDSLKAWEEENSEYATWNLIDDEQETASC